jgi:heme exporter protein C
VTTPVRPDVGSPTPMDETGPPSSRSAPSTSTSTATSSSASAGAGAGAGTSGRVQYPAHTGSTTTRVLGVIALLASALLVYLALVGTPEDAVQGEAVRLLYIHVPVVTIGYLACFATTLASGIWLWKRSHGWDLAAAAFAELGALFIAATLVTGAIWGGAAWGVFWVWDARLTSTALLFLLLLGYLAVRRIPAAPEARGRRSAVLGLLLTPNIFIINRAVYWWRSVHQDATVMQLGDPKIHDSMQFTLMYGMAVAVVVFAWLAIHRFRVAYLQDQVDERGLEQAIADRRGEVAS